MSETFNMPTDQYESTVPLPHRGGHFVLSNSHSVSMPPDSNSNLSNLNEQEAINMAECSLVGNVHNATFGQGDLCVVTSNINQAFIATPVSGSSHFWNESMNRICNEQTESAMYMHFNKSAEDEGNSEGMSPDSDWRESQLSSCSTSCRGSSENDCCSLSSGEMVIRNNSFCLEEESLIVISSLEESSVSPAPSRSSFPVESNLLSTTLPDMCQKSTGGGTEENAGHPCLGVTFTQADSLEILTEENITTPSPVVALPSESEGGLLMTFICESSADPIKEVKSASTEAELSPHLSRTFTPEQGMTFVSPMQRNDNNDIHTSTPVQNIGNNILSLPSLSPCAEKSGSPGHQPVKRQQVSLSSKRHPVAGLPLSLSKVKKMEIPKFSKLSLSNAKSKGVPRAHQVVVPRSASQRNPLQANGLNKCTEAVKVPPAKAVTCSTVVRATSNILYDTRRQGNRKAANWDATVKQSCGHNVVGQSKTRASSADHNSAANNHVSPVPCTNTHSEMMQGASSQVSDASALHAGSQTCESSLEKSPTTSGQMDPKPTPKKDVSNKIEVRSGLALGQDKFPPRETQPSCSSESSTSRPPKKRTTFKVATSFTTPKADTDQLLNKPASQKCSSQNKRVEETKRPPGNSPREVKKISLVAEPVKSTASGDPRDATRNGSHVQSSPKRGRRTSLSQPPPASPRPPPLSAKQRQGALGRDECRISRGVGSTPFQQKNSAGSRRTEGPSLGNKPQLNGFWPPQTPRPSPMGHPPSTPCRLPRKTPGPSRALTDCSGHSEPSQGSRSASVSGGAPQKPTPLKAVVLRSRLISTPGKTSGPSLTTTCKQAASTNKGVSSSAVSPLKRTASSRLGQPTSGGPVDKNKSKASSRQPSSQPNQSTGLQNVVQASVTQVEKKAQDIHQLQQLLTASNCRFQAVAIVLQQTLAERDEATRQCRELSQELVSLRGELVCSVHSSEHLEKEKEDLRVALEDALQKLQEQHQKDQVELEQRLQAFYQAECDKARLAHQEEADKCKTFMQQQMDELKASHEAMKLELENSHTEHLQCVERQHETKLEELREVHKQELQSLDKTLKDAEASLSGQIQKLTMENNALIEKLAAEENRRKELAQNSQKDAHTLYLEQELESLKVVLELKNKQLHQQEKKLMEVDKLTEKNVKLDESLKRVLQENEDLKARMERHAALSRQLSTEQVMLQESLQKESKVNKRLSMENEELLWKLHNGELNSPRKLSPSSASPSHAFSLHSPRSSGLFSSPPLSPR